MVRQTFAPTTSGLDYFGYHEKNGHEMRENYEKSDHLIMAKVSKQGSYFVKSLLRFVFTTLRNWIIS